MTFPPLFPLIVTKREFSVQCILIASFMASLEVMPSRAKDIACRLHLSNLVFPLKNTLTLTHVPTHRGSPFWDVIS